MAVKVGDLAPMFKATSDSGEVISLADYIGKLNVVLYFYPKDDTPGCTKEACSFRDSWDELTGLGAVVFGVSSDGMASHKAFRERHKLPFPLLSDNDKEIRTLYGAKGLLIPPRVTFVIDKSGRIVHVYSSQLNPEAHAREAINVLKRLQGRSTSPPG